MNLNEIKINVLEITIYLFYLTIVDCYTFIKEMNLGFTAVDLPFIQILSKSFRFFS